MRQLTDEELSRVLSMHAIGKLNHGTYGRREDDLYLPGCGCVASAALNVMEKDVCEDDDEWREAREISDAANPGLGPDNYAPTPEGLLAYLANRGLA